VGHLTPVAFLEVLDKEPPVRFRQILYFMPHQRPPLPVHQQLIERRAAIGQFHSRAWQGFGGPGLAAGFVGYQVADAAYERAEPVRLADAPIVHQRKHPIEGFIANVFDRALVSELVSQSGF
jgi:hypothetical protein